MRETAFTRVELCATLAAITLLALIVAPVLANTTYGGERAACFNNMRLIGQGVASWAGDHQGGVPWRVSVNDGGTWPSSGTKPGNAWFEYSVLSNELRTPKILVCPADAKVLVVATFQDYIRSGYRAGATSYGLGMEWFPEEPRSWLSGDRHVRVDPANASPCSAKIVGFERIDPANSVVAWTNNVHGTVGGNIVLHDGSVSFVASENLRAVLTRATDAGSTHFLRAR